MNDTIAVVVSAVNYKIKKSMPVANHLDQLQILTILLKIRVMLLCSA